MLADSIGKIESIVAPAWRGQDVGGPRGHIPERRPPWLQTKMVKAKGKERMCEGAGCASDGGMVLSLGWKNLKVSQARSRESKVRFWRGPRAR